VSPNFLDGTQGICLGETAKKKGTSGRRFLIRMGINLNPQSNHAYPMSTYNAMIYAVAESACHAPNLPVSREKPVQLLLSLRRPASLGSANTELDTASQVLSLDEISVLVASQGIENSSDEAASVISISLHVAHNHLDGHVGGGLMPAVIVRGHADHLVSNLGLTGKLGFRKDGHVDHAAAPGAVHLALGAGGELGALCSKSWLAL